MVAAPEPVCPERRVDQPFILHLLFFICLNLLPAVLLFYPGITHLDETVGLSPLPYRWLLLFCLLYFEEKELELRLGQSLPPIPNRQRAPSRVSAIRR